jgi:Zn-dependent protease/CBS domain-containing protein
MGGSLKIFQVGPTAVRIHPTFFLLLAWIGGVNWVRGGPAAALDGVVFIALLFACVVLHEFGHIWAAARYGIRTPDVTLLPIGGVASLERMPEKPGQEIAVALAGPAVNLVIAGVLIAFLGLQIDADHIVRMEDMQAGLAGRIAAANIALFVFNLIPAFPMDGGRVLRAVLAIWLGFPRATQIAAAIGQALAVGLGFLGLFGNPLLVLVAVFIFFAASGEAGYVQAREMSRGYRARDAMITSFQTLGPQSVVDDAATLLLRTTQQEFPVVDGGQRLRGVLTRDQLVRALQEKGPDVPVLEVMSRDVRTIPENGCLDTIFKDLQAGREKMIGVINGAEQLVGYITPENIAELVVIRSSRERAREAQARAA